MVGVGAPRGVVLGPVGRLHAGQQAHPHARGWVSACGWGTGRWWVNGGTTGTTTTSSSFCTALAVHLHGHVVRCWLGGVWVRARAPACWCWDDGVVVVAFIVEGAVGVFRWHWRVSGEGGVGLTEWALSSPLSSLQPLHPLHPLLLLQCPRARWEAASWPRIVAVRGGGGGGARLSGARGLGQKLKT